MTRRDVLKAGLAGLGLGLTPFPLGWAAGAETPKRHLLFYSRSQGFEHSVIKRGKNGQLSLAEQIVTDLGAKHGFEVTCTKDGSVFLPESIGRFDAFLFETTGDLTKEGGDHERPMPPEGKKALLEAIAGGKGFVGSHCASDTFHSGEGEHDRLRNQSPDQYDPYITMLGGEFIHHGAQQPARMVVVDDRFPGAPHLTAFEMHEEWYALKNFSPDLHVILLQDPHGMKTDKGNWLYDRPPFPATWARKYEKGRVFYTSMGHREDVWQNPLFEGLLLGALAWAFGNVSADVTPNLAKVAPKAAELPEPREEKKK
jgi:type 1 glutamine amidotransferase